MTFIKIAEKQNFQNEVFIQFKNNSCDFIFACEKNFLFQYFESQPNENSLTTLANLFSHDLVKYFANKLNGELLHVHKITFNLVLNPKLESLDINLQQNSQSDDIYFARLYSNSNTMTLLKEDITQKSIAKNINKLTGFQEVWGELEIDRKYQVKLKQEIRTLSSRQQLLKCVYLIEDNLVEFYFPEKIVNYFSSFVIKKLNTNSIHFIVGKMFAELFCHYLNNHCSVFAKKISSEVQFVKNKEFLEFNMAPRLRGDDKITDADTPTKFMDKNFQFFCDVKNKLFIIKCLHALQFQSQEPKKQSPVLNHLQLPFSAEIGVCYLNEMEYKNITEGDIIVFDKTCLSTETMHVNKCVIHLNGLGLIASLQKDSCQVVEYTKDW